MSGKRQTTRRIVVLAVALATLAAACTGGDGGEPAATEPTTEAAAPTVTVEQPATVQPPSDFTAEPAPFAVTLSWTPPPDGAERFSLYRDGRWIAATAGTESLYTDDDVLPGREYVYEVEAQAGGAAAARVLARAATPVPPRRAARLAGRFDVKVRVLSQTGYGDYPRSGFGWQFRPRCDEGACTVVWSDLHRKTIRTTLRRSGSRYRGTYTGPFGLACGGTDVPSTVTIDLRVRTARVVVREWRATQLVGAVTHSEAAQLGCRYSEARLFVRARLVR